LRYIAHPCVVYILGLVSIELAEIPPALKMLLGGRDVDNKDGSWGVSFYYIDSDCRRQASRDLKNRPGLKLLNTTVTELFR